MGDHSRPLHTFEEAIHIPLILRHPGKISSGSTFDGRTCNYDFLPSLLDYLELDSHSPMNSPGRNYAPAMRGQSLDWDDTIYHDYENTRMVRLGKWKYAWRHPDGPDELYDMEADPGERENLAGKAELTEVIGSLRAQISEFFDRYADPEYDLWKGGRSKAGRMLKD